MKKEKGITLIALIITIIVMLILVGVTINVSLNGGLFTYATKANFYTEMTAINSQKAMSKIINFMEQGKQNGVESNFLEKKVPVEAIKNFSNTLKAEIVFARNAFGKGEMVTTSQIWKNNLYDCQALFSDEWIDGLTSDLSYISKQASGYEETYIYDATTDMCYKIADTRIGKHIVHSIEYAKFILDGENSNGIGIIDTETSVITSTEGTTCYEPDLNNFSYKTEIVYYSPDFTDEYTITVKEFFEKGKPATITTNGKIYTFANYVPIGSEKETVWANIKCTANGLESYWVWIPRFAYKLDASVSKAEKSDIIFVDVNDKPMDGGELPEGYVVHEAFKQKEGLKGIWFSKYEPTPLETMATDYTEPGAPDLTNFVAENTKLIYYTIDGKTSIEVDYSENPAQTIEQNGTTYYFYNYVNKIWANIKCETNGLESYWVWIPRFAYKLESGESKVILVDTNDQPIDKQTYGSTLPSSYKVHEAFTQQPEMLGMWFSKYQPSALQTETIDTIEAETPDLTNFVAENTKLIYYTIDGKSSIEVEYSVEPEQSIVQDGTTYYFYNYTKKIWANIKCETDGVQSYWVWIPRFAYKIESGTTKVILIDENDDPLNTSEYGSTLPEGYTVHEAFLQQSGLKGIWFSKYEPSKHVQP